MNSRPTQRIWALLVALSLLSSTAIAQTSARLSSGRALFAGCVSCHQPQGWGSADGNIPNIAGQQANYLEKQIALFRAGVRRDEAMRVVAEHPNLANSADVKALARYIAALAPNPHPVFGPGKHLGSGQDAYEHICAACHGTDGRGDAATGAPRIAGQHYPYLQRQISAAATFHRELAPAQMTSALRALDSASMDALADYISRRMGLTEGDN
jgi:cytochrome c553